MSTGKTLRLRVTAQEAGLRLDQAVARLAPDTSRAEARRLIALGSVFLAGARTKVASRVVRDGQSLEVHLAPRAALSALPIEPPEIPILLLRDDLVVVDKPSGLLTAPTKQTDQADLLFFLKQSLGDLYLVHRLDAQTSGVLLLARTRAAASALSSQLETRTLGRKYSALVAGIVPSDFTAEGPIDGRPARTHFRIVERAPRATRVEAELETGRTHQIRIHAQTAGHPILGDRKYGGSEPTGLPRAPRLALHATRLRFVDPKTGAPTEVEAPFPPDLTAYWTALC